MFWFVLVVAIVSFCGGAYVGYKYARRAIQAATAGVTAAIAKVNGGGGM